MKKILTKDAVAGEVLARDVRDQNGKLLFSKGTGLESAHIDGLRTRRIKHIFIEGRDIPAELSYFDSQSIKKLELDIDSSFQSAGDDDITKETKRVATKLIMGRAMRKGDILTKSQMNLIDKLKDIPPLPQPYLQLKSMVDNPKTTGKSFSAVLKNHPHITDRILQLTNTSFFKFPNPPSKIEGAVSMMGLRNTADMTLPFFLMESLRSGDGILDELISKIWAHSLGAGIAVNTIIRKTKMKLAHDLFVPCFMHDIGKTAIAVFCPEDFLHVENYRTEKGNESYTSELTLLGYSHADSGKIVADKWALDPLTGAVIKNHHTPFDEKLYRRETCLVHTGNFFSHSLHFGGSDEHVPPVDDDCWNIIGVKLDDIEPIMQETESIFDEAAEIFLT